MGFALLGLFAIAWLGSTKNLTAITTLSMSASSMVIGIVTSLTAMFKPDSRITNQVFLPLASGLLALGVLLCAYKLAYAGALENPEQPVQASHGRLGLGWDHVLVLGFGSALLLGWFANVNYITFARFYRDRLKETFMPNSNALKQDGEQSLSREVWLKDLCNVSSGQSKTDENQDLGPYHLINTNVVLIDSDDKKCNRRGGDSFILWF